MKLRQICSLLLSVLLLPPVLGMGSASGQAAAPAFTEAPAPTPSPIQASYSDPGRQTDPPSREAADPAVPEASPGETPSPESAPALPERSPAPESPTESPTEAPTETPEPEPEPPVIDRITNPNQSPDFSFSPEDDLLEIWFPAIRDQDCAIFLYQDQVWLLDCGDERAATDILPLMKHLGIRQVDRLINTHPHHDHLNGLYSIDAAIPVRELMICFPEDSTVHMTAAMEYCKGNRIPVTHFSDETVLSMGDGLVSFLCWQKSGESESINDRSALFMVSYGLRKILFMADMELRGQRQLYDVLGPAPLAADILRYPHHGKKAMVEDFYAAVNPSLVIITNAPRIAELAESIQFLDYKHVPVAYTRQRNLVLHLVTDGQNWLCEQVPFDSAPYLTPAPDA